MRANKSAPGNTAVPSDETNVPCDEVAFYAFMAILRMAFRRRREASKPSSSRSEEP